MPPIPEPGSLPAAGSDIQLFTRTWSAESPRAAVVVLHGYAEHGGRHIRLAERLVEAGYSVLAFDQRGFGQSGGKPGYVRAFPEYVADAVDVLVHARERWAGLPIFLFGHSMGGAVAALTALERPDLMDGLLLCSPLLRTFESPVLQRLAGIVGTVLPWLPTVPLDRSLLSRNPVVVEDANSDPFCYHGRVKARTGRELVRAMQKIEASGHKLDLPLLILHGTADRLTDPSASGDLYARATSTDKQLGLFEGLAHETFNEPEGPQVLDTIVEWLDEHCGVET